MADRGITFSAPMVRALLDGSKTQTRRLLHLRGYRQFSEFGPSDTPGYDWHFRRSDACWCDFRAQDLPLPHATGDRLYVREHWKAHVAYEDLAPGEMGGDETVLYLADMSLSEPHPDMPERCVGRHRQAMHMPRWASRLTLIVTDVRVQRLQDISEADCIAEGIDAVAIKHFGCPVKAYAALWDSLHGGESDQSWLANPWIYAVTFDVQHGNIDNL